MVLSLISIYKRIVCLFFILFTLENVSAQDLNGITLPRIIPSSPVAQEFQKFLGDPVSGATRLVDVSIPIYDLSLSGINIPLSLKSFFWYKSRAKFWKCWLRLDLTSQFQDQPDDHGEAG